MTVRYRHHGFALVRSTTEPGDLALPHDLNLDDPEAIHSEGRVWLASAWSRSEVREAVSAASPILAARIAQLLASPELAGTRDLRRVIASLAAYLLRWQRRVTPFGLFAGVLAATVGPGTASIGTAHWAVARPASGWIASLTRQITRNQALRGQFTVTANALAVVRDGRLVLSCRGAPTARTPGPAREASVRWTRPVRAALEMAASPVQLSTLTASLAARFPSASAPAIRELTGQAEQGFLITGIQPPQTANDPLEFLCAALRGAARRRDSAGARNASAATGTR